MNRIACLLALAGLIVPLGACAHDSYAGVSFETGGDPATQALARRARAGDKRAQLDLGLRYEEGRDGMPFDLARAEQLYRAASQGRDGLADARQGYVRVRSRRLAMAAAEQGPRSVFNEVYMARRLGGDRRLSNRDADRIAIQRIDGPVLVSGTFVARSEDPDSSELCQAIESLVAQYHAQGFEDCDASAYGNGTGAGAGLDLFLLSYRDRYEETEEFLSNMGHVTYRPPYSYDLALEPGDSLSGEFLAFDVFVRSGRRYRILITRNPAAHESRQTRPPARN